MNIITKVIYALNQLPNTPNVGPNGESTYELVSELMKLQGKILIEKQNETYCKAKDPVNKPFNMKTCNCQFFCKHDGVEIYKKLESSPEMSEPEHYKTIPKHIDRQKAIKYGRCNYCGKWYGDCKGH